MSCDYDLRCKPCKAFLGLDINHGDRACRDLIANRGALEALSEVVRGIQGEPDVRVEVLGRLIDLKFFTAHKGHVLEVVDEYGRVQGQCTKYPDCACCGRRFQCQMPDGHEGACDPRFKA